MFCSDFYIKPVSSPLTISLAPPAPHQNAGWRLKYWTEVEGRRMLISRGGSTERVAQFPIAVPVNQRQDVRDRDVVGTSATTTSSSLGQGITSVIIAR